MGSANPGVSKILRWNMLSRGFRFKDHLPIWSPEPNGSLSGGGYLYEYNADGDLWMVHDRFPWSCRKIKSALYSAALSDAIPILGPNGEFNRELTRKAWSKLLKRDGAADLRDRLRKAGPKVRSLRYWWYEKGGHQYYKTTVGDMIDLALEGAAPDPGQCLYMGSGTTFFTRPDRGICTKEAAVLVEIGALHRASMYGMVYRKGGKAGCDAFAVGLASCVGQSGAGQARRLRSTERTRVHSQAPPSALPGEADQRADSDDRMGPGEALTGDQTWMHRMHRMGKEKQKFVIFILSILSILSIHVHPYPCGD